MNKICQNCKNSFFIDQTDQDFYKKVDVPTPTFCSMCRLQRRLSFLNWISLNKRICTNCNKEIMSSINSDSNLRVYCSVCWWGDSWDGTEYGMEYDPSKNFFEQLFELKNRSNFMCLESLYPTLVNSPYVNATAYMKDCFMVFNADYGEKTAYTMVFAHANECLDNYRLKKCELCYECTGIHKCYRCIYSQELDSCTDVLFSYGCSGCTDCFGCINLRNKSYYIFNVRYSKEEYFEKIKEFKLDTREGIKKAYNESRAFWLTKPRRAVIGNGLNFNTTGDFIYESKNTHDSYMISGAEDCRYVSCLTLAPTKNCYDYTNWGAGAENLYECLTVGEGAYNNKFCVQCWPQAMNNEYCLYANSSQNCFGCINIKKKQYCILNKQYTEEEYTKLKKKIIEDMKKNPYIDNKGRVYTYGELFPPALSPFLYNETMAQYYFPLTKEQAEESGVTWYTGEKKNHAITLKNIPESVEDIHDSIITEVLECRGCRNGFNITEIEVYLHKKICVPLPDSCWKCRFNRRFNSVNLPRLYDRECDKCKSLVKSSYAKERPEIVYCEKCYQEEIS